MAFPRHAPPAPNACKSASRLVAVAMVSLCLAGCTGIESFDHAPAVQAHHLSGVPHVTDRGAVSKVPVPSESRIQRILYHALTGRHHGLDYDLRIVKLAGFTAVHPWEGQDNATFLESARRAGLGTVPHNPDETIAAQADRLGVLAWYLDEEPVLRFPEARQEALREAFRNRRADLHRAGPWRPVFALLGPPLSRTRPAWDRWTTEGDLSAHDNYAVHGSLAVMTTPARHVARSVAFARSLIPEDRPLWFVVQAFSSEDRGWNMPTAHEYRAMAMAALIHGASGIVTFAFDSFVTRDDHVLGIAPEPMADYGADLPDYNGDGKPHRVASEAELERSVALWNDVAAFNRYIEHIESWLLLPNRPDILSVEMTGRSGLASPVRVAVKRDGNSIMAFAINLVSEPVEVTYRLRGNGPVALESRYPFGPQRRSDLTNGIWHDTLEGLGVRVYRISDDHRD